MAGIASSAEWSPFVLVWLLYRFHTFILIHPLLAAKKKTIRPKFKMRQQGARILLNYEDQQLRLIEQQGEQIDRLKTVVREADVIMERMEAQVLQQVEINGLLRANLALAEQLAEKTKVLLEQERQFNQLLKQKVQEQASMVDPFPFSIYDTHYAHSARSHRTRRSRGQAPLL